MFLKRSEIDSDSEMDAAKVFLAWQATPFQSKGASTAQL
jgi:hypothetical protein